MSWSSKTGKKTMSSFCSIWESSLLEIMTSWIARRKKMVVDKHVIGSVPLGMAALCKSVTVVNFFYPKEKQGQELTLKEMYEYYEGTYRYQVNEQEIIISEH